MSQDQNSKKLEWINKVEQWKLSGKSAQRWCRENLVVYTTFMGWLKRLDVKSIKKTTRQNPAKPQFIELEDQSKKKSEISLEFQGVLIHLKDGFDPSLLKQCISVLRGISC